MSRRETTNGEEVADREVGAPRGRYAIDPVPGDTFRSVVEVQRNYEQALLDQGGKLATPETYAYYQRFPVAPLWVVVALLCFADPRRWSVEQMRKVPVCRDRLQIAIREVRSNRRQGHGVDNPTCYELTRVGFEWARRWAMQSLLPVPSRFPAQGSHQARVSEQSRSESEKKARPVRNSQPRSAKGERLVQAKHDTALLLREADLLPLLPFSRATLWRRVKEGRFPRPGQPSPGVTAWLRADIDKWLEEQFSPVSPASTKRARRKA